MSKSFTMGLQDDNCNQPTVPGPPQYDGRVVINGRCGNVLVVSIQLALKVVELLSACGDNWSGILNAYRNALDRDVLC